jgi:ArsR family transcriptional regulator
MLASELRALAHPARLIILRALAARQICLCGDLVEVLPLAQATVSQHLNVLREVGLLRGETDGPARAIASKRRHCGAYTTPSAPSSVN